MRFSRTRKPLNNCKAAYRSCRATTTGNWWNWKVSINLSWAARRRNMHRRPQGSKTGLHGRGILSAVSASCCSKQTTSSARLFTVLSVLPVIITSPVLIRNRYRTSRVPLICSGRTDNHIGRQVISCISQPSKRAGLTNGSKSKPDGRLTMWWRDIMTNNRKKVFQWEDSL